MPKPHSTRTASAVQIGGGATMTGTKQATAAPLAPARGVTVPATEAQNRFGAIVDRAARQEDVIITRHDVPRVAVISIERYRELVGVAAAALGALTAEFDAMLARMQTRPVRDGTRRGFHAGADELAAAAEVTATHPRPRG